MAKIFQFNRKPDYQGVAKAWKMIVGPDALLDHSAIIKSYVINGPYHSFWNWWLVAVVHLRPIEGAEPPIKHYSEAEYEFMIVSISPEGNAPDPDKTFPQDIQYLTPPDCVVQFHGVTDEQAGIICDDAARAIAAGQSCDSDFRSWWIRSIKATVDHYRQGTH